MSKNIKYKITRTLLIPAAVFLIISGCTKASTSVSEPIETTATTEATIEAATSEAATSEMPTTEAMTTEATTTEAPTTEAPTEAADTQITSTVVTLTSDMKYAENSMISTGSAVLYSNPAGNNITVCVNAGHGTTGGSSVKTLSHPDGSAKITGGTTAAGQIYSTAVSSGMTFLDGTTEADVTLAAAILLKDELLSRGYNVLMIRESKDVQLDNVARSVLANNYADCHIAIHWDSTETDKGAFYCKVPDVADYKAMEPVTSTWEKSDKLGEMLINGLSSNGFIIFGSGYMEMDLTQTSYSSVPSIDIECGDKASDHSEAELKSLAKALADGVDAFYSQS